MKRSFDDLSDSSGGEPLQKRPRALEDSDDSLSDEDPQQKPWKFEDSDSLSDEGPQQRPRALDDSDCSLADEDPQVLRLGLALTDEICESITDGVEDALNRIVCSVLFEFVYEAWWEITHQLLPVDDGGASAETDVSMQGVEEKVSWTTVGPLLAAAAREKFPVVIRAAMSGEILDLWIEDIERSLEGMVNKALHENEHRPRDETLFKDMVGDTAELRGKFEDAMTDEVLGRFLRAVLGVVDEHMRTVCAENAGEVGPAVLYDILDENISLEFHDAIMDVADEELPPLGLPVCWALCRRLAEVMRGPDPSGGAEEAGGGSSSDTAVTCDQMMGGLTLGERGGGQAGSDEDGEYDEWESNDGEESSDEENGDGEQDYDGDTEVGYDGDESSDGEESDGEDESSDGEERCDEEEEDDSDTDEVYEGEDEDNEDESDSEEHEEDGQVEQAGQEESGDVSMGGI